MTKLEKQEYTDFQETLYKGRLENGMRVYLIPKKDFHEIHVSAVSDFGAVDTHVVVDGQSHHFPEGIAHFLEHKLFEKENGVDLAVQMTVHGAEVNAYTSYDRTVYFFSTTQSIEEPLGLLQDLIQLPYFTAESIQREVGIIDQELDMYLDDPDYVLYQGVLSQLYPETPLASDIAGTHDSIRNISEEMLYANSRIFYQPEQLTLIVVGNIDPERIFDQIKTRQTKRVNPSYQIEKIAFESKEVVKTGSSYQSMVSTPKVAVGFKLPTPLIVETCFKTQLLMMLYLEMLFGDTSPHYQKLYQEGKLNASFAYELEVNQRFHYIILSQDTEEPIASAQRLKNQLKQYRNDEVMNQEQLEKVKKEMIGEFYRSLDSIESMAGHFVSYLYKGEGQTWLDFPAILTAIRLDEVQSFMEEFVKQAEQSDFTIFPR